MAAVFQDNILAGKVAYITGGGSGINLGIAEVLAVQGATVVLVGRTLEKVEAAAAEITARGSSALGLSADVRDYAAVAATLATTHERYGEIDIVIAGAAGNFPAAATGMSANGFKAVVDIDLNGTFNTCRAAYEYLRKPGASVIAITAGQAFQAAAYQSHVCAAKAGVDMLMRVLAIEWGPAGVRVNSIAPGPIDDTEGMRRLAPTEEARETLTKSVPLRRYGTKNDIAQLALFLCSDAATYITGASMVCDGGQSLLGFGSWSMS